MSTVASFCRTCGRALTDEEKAVPETIYCSACAPAQQSAPPQGPPPPPPPIPNLMNGPSPGLAFLLGLIPGVGAIYNAQYAKGLIHVFLFGLMISIAESTRGELQPLLILTTMGVYFYMPFEAYHTANRRLRGQAVDEFSSIVPLKGGSLVGPVILIVLGVIFLLNNLDLLHISQMLRFWPVGLIALGVYLLYTRLNTVSDTTPSQEVRHE